MAKTSNPSRPAQSASRDPNTTLPTARRPLMLAISSVLLAGALGSGAQAQSWPPVISLDSQDGTNGFRFDATKESGRSVASAGDINGDGIDDLIIGSRYASPNGISAGASYVVFGKDTATAGDFAAELEASSLDGSNGFRLDGQGISSRSGFSVSSAGDINGDGIDDLVIGAPLYGGSDEGRAYVVFGKNTAIAGNTFPATLALSSLNGTNGFRFDGQDADWELGISVAAVGDFNGDGADDLAIGAGSGLRGIFVFSANDAPRLPNGDFRPSYDLVEFANYQFFFGTMEPNFRCRCSVASAGDVNNDGIDDLIVGSIETWFEPISSYVVFGTPTIIPTILQTSDLDGTNGFRLQGETTSDGFSYSVSSAGDINGDGIDDLIVGAYAADPDGRTNAGSSYVVFGKDTGIAGNFPATLSVSSLDGTDGFRIDGVSSNNASGTSVASAGDINGDGFDDLIIGAPGYLSTSTNKSYVVFGKNTAIVGNAFPATLALSDLDGSHGFRIDGPVDAGRGVPINDLLGRSVAAAGDVNGDGIEDLILGAPGIDPNPDIPGTEGVSYVVFGGISGPGLVPRVALDTNTLEFGDIALGDTALRTLIVENSGTSTLLPGALSIHRRTGRRIQHRDKQLRQRATGRGRVLLDRHRLYPG